MKRVFTLLIAVMGLGIYSSSAQSLQLPSPQEGKCFVECLKPAEYRTEEVRILKQPAYKKLRVIPATFQTVEERVLVKEATKKFVYHPAVYETQEVEYISQETEPTMSVIPASLQSSSERIKVFPEGTQWTFQSRPDCRSSNPYDCRYICPETVQARYTTVATQVLANNARTENGTKPQQTRTYTKQVVVEEAHMEEIPIEAEYSTITKRVVDQPARVEEEMVDAVYETVTKEVLVSPSEIVVEEVDCELVAGVKLAILWDYNSAQLNSDAKDVIEREVLTLMREKPNVDVELASHTDSRGTREYNRNLSQRRADAIKNYLVSQGIDADRIRSIGYGEDRLLNNCSDGVQCSEAQHQENRRTEYRVLGG